MAAGVIAALTLATACSTKDAAGASDDSEGLKTDYGVTDTQISLGALTDTSGPFKAAGLATLYGHQIWADEVNKAGGICDRKIVIDAQDHGYKADSALALYAQMKQTSLGLLHLVGSPMLAALKAQMTTDQVLTGVPSIASSNLDTPSIISVSATYDIEMINGLKFLNDSGKLDDGAKLGQVYLDSEAGQNALAGTKAYAKEHDLTLVEIPIAATDTDMTAVVAKLKSEDVDAVAVMSSPPTLASIGIGAASQGLDVPILGAWGTYSPTLASDQLTVDALKDNYYVTTSLAAWDADLPAAQDVRDAYAAKGITDQPSGSVFTGYLLGVAWGEILNRACADGDLTRAGVMAAREKIDNVDTQGLSGTLDLSDPGAPTTREVYIEQLDPTVPGGLKTAEDLFVAPEAKSYKTPYQK